MLVISYFSYLNSLLALWFVTLTCHAENKDLHICSAVKSLWYKLVSNYIESLVVLSLLLS